MVRQVRGKVKEEPGYRDWREIYESRLTTAAEAVRAVKSGDIVVYFILAPKSLQEALFARRRELSDVTIRLLAPTFDPGWFQPGSEGSFHIEFEFYIGDFARFVTDERRGTYLPNLFSLSMQPYDDGRPDVRPPDVAMVRVSPPNSQGYCHFGAHHWTQRAYVRRAKTVIAEVDSELIRVHGDCYVHVSEIDAFVEGTPVVFNREEFDRIMQGVDPERRAAWVRLWEALPDPSRLAPLAGLMTSVSPEDALRFLGLMPPPPYAHTIAGYLSELIEDGDTMQIGVGEPSRLMPNLGVFDGKHDLGLHTELGSPGLGRLVQEGIITGRRKSIDVGKAVAIAWTGCREEDLAIIDDNPAFEIRDPEYVLSLRTLLQFENFVAINNAISVDLLGQINAESVFGGRIINGTGGQPEMHMAAAISPGGRAITLMPATALEGAVSRIVAQLETGSYVTIPRFYADVVVTEYGVARLWGKNHRQRAEELIAVAHPDFRAELRREAQKLWWP
jgi:4-hydroxybutyrate CoA-transferase